MSQNNKQKNICISAPEPWSQTSQLLLWLNNIFSAPWAPYTYSITRIPAIRRSRLANIDKEKKKKYLKVHFKTKRQFILIHRQDLE